MKPSKSPETNEVTPSKKKLKQARLPFKLISEGSPTPVTPPTRKRKLSAADADTVPKIGRISKENDLLDNAVVISDEETTPEKATNEEKPLNPFVKLVDTAWKKKLQKNKKRKTVKKSKNLVNGSTDTVNNENAAENVQEVEEMDVDLPPQEVETNGESFTDSVNDKVPLKRSRKATLNKKAVRKSKASPKSRASPRNASKTTGGGKLSSEEIVVLEDSNHSDGPSDPKDSKPDIDSAPVVNETEICKSEESTEEAETRSSAEVVKQDNHDITSSEENEDDDKSIQSGEKDEGDDITKDAQLVDENPQSEENETPGLVTPKRSTRNKAKADEKELSINKSKLDDSICSNPVTPKPNKSLSATTSLDDSLNESSANLTPKQLQKKLEAAKKLEERNKEKLEREKKKQQEKEERAKQRQEKEDQKKKEREEKEEAKKKEKEEKEEQRRKEKEEKEKQKELEKKLREEKEELKKKEKEEKEEQRKKEKEAREEEKRKKQEALELEKQEQELKKKKAAEAFVNFFVPKQKSEKDQATADAGPISKSSVLSSFAIKSDMRLAPTIRVNLSDDKKQLLENLMEEQKINKSGLYISNLRGGTAKPLFSGKTWPLSERDDNDDDDVMIVEDELPALHGACEEVALEPTVREKLRPKLFSFHENRRPPYWGTWRKKSAEITPRRPFGQDTKNLDYEVDSDEEWEEEPEGESVDGSAAGSDADDDLDEYEVDNELFVPHGYLSDEEATMDDDDVLSLSPETQKARLKHLEDEFESEMKKPTEKLKPRLYGILWETKDGGKPDNCVDALWNYFGKWSMIMNDPTPLLQPSNEPEEGEKKKVKKKKVVVEGETPKASPKSEKKKKPKTENKESKPKNDQKKNTAEVKNQPGINSFLTKLKSS